MCAGLEIPTKIGWLGTTVGTEIQKKLVGLAPPSVQKCTKNRLVGYHRRYRNPEKIGWFGTTVGSEMQKIGWLGTTVGSGIPNKIGWLGTTIGTEIQKTSVGLAPPSVQKCKKLVGWVPPLVQKYKKNSLVWHRPKFRNPEKIS